ncbi:MAG: ABC transporter ATP-binding protein [Clostridia bacterium]|nr:ABC transporter ATP-binding protein [Clostridia bacterium]
MDILQVKNITKKFDDRVIIDNVSFNIPRGRIVGLLGKNGSGKTTILKMINDLLTIDSGEILINGKPISADTKLSVSFLPERSYLDNSRTVLQTFHFFQDFYPDFDIILAQKLLSDLDIDINTKLSKMSKGMKEKVQLILVMSRHASLYILDEPLGGVDPSTRDYILKTILTNFDSNSSLLITTHLVADVEKILDDVIMIDQGKVILSDTADNLRNQHSASIDEIFRRVL